MRQIQRTLRILALLFCGEHLVAQPGQVAFQFAFASDMRLDVRAQRLDLFLAQQCTLLGGTGAQHAHPTLSKTLAGTGDDGLAIAEPRLQAARIGQRFCSVQARQQATNRARPLHFRCE